MTTDTPTRVSTIGSVEVLVPRIYSREDGSEVIVEPGTYPILQDTTSQSIYWTMVGPINERMRFNPIDGMVGAFTVQTGDHRSDVQAPVLSKMFTPDEFTEFRSSDPLVVDGPDQRLRIVMF